ncbi:MAG TPA: Grx4 family monothiol glutaredoxin [Polyangiaceae bacterium]|jgi:monothiol glutaredoxin
MNPMLKARLESEIRKDTVVLFMKGNRSTPRCGFSARVVELLDSVLDDYATVDVLEDPAVREGIKEYSSWPTIPQLFVFGEFVGGSDIVAELYESGELFEKLRLSPPSEPELTLTPGALQALRDALESPRDCVRLEITRAFENELSIGERRPSDVVLSNLGVPLVLDRESASRANGVSIDLVSTSEGPAFKIVNPSAPAAVRQMSPEELARKISAGEPLRVLDVRTPEELNIARIETARALDDESQEELSTLDRGMPLVFVCHHGVRSRAAAEQYALRGFRNVYNLIGGIDAWSERVDPNVPRY